MNTVFRVAVYLVAAISLYFFGWSVYYCVALNLISGDRLRYDLWGFLIVVVLVAIYEQIRRRPKLV